MTDPWGDPPQETSPEEFTRVMAVFDEIQRGYDRDAKLSERRMARRHRRERGQD